MLEPPIQNRDAYVCSNFPAKITTLAKFGQVPDVTGTQPYNPTCKLGALTFSGGRTIPVSRGREGNTPNVVGSWQQGAGGCWTSGCGGRRRVGLGGRTGIPRSQENTRPLEPQEGPRQRATIGS